MRFVLLRYDYLVDRPTIEAMDKDRPHAIVLIEVRDLSFALPLRTNLNHKFGFKTINNSGLDFSKALLIFEDKDISTDIKLSSAKEFKVIVESEHYIKSSFGKYVDGYVHAVSNGHTSQLKRDYKYSTLVNYHKQLGLEGNS